MGDRAAWRRAEWVIETDVPRLSVVDPVTGLLDRGFALAADPAEGDRAMIDALAALAARVPARPERVRILHQGHAPPQTWPTWCQHLPAAPLWLDAGFCAVWGEALHGGGGGAPDQLHLGLGTATSGLVLNGLPSAGAQGQGAVPACFCVDPKGPPCACGGRGHLAAYADLPGLTQAGADLGLRGERPDRPGRDVGVLADLVERAGTGCPLALRVLERAGHALGVVAGALLNALDLVDVVIHCPVPGAWAAAAPAARAAMGRHCFEAVAEGVVWRSATLAGEAAPLGAVYLPADPA